MVVTPRDAFRQRVFLAPLGLWLTLDAGRVSRVTFNPSTRVVHVTLDPATPDAPTALLRLGQTPTGPLPAHFAPAAPLPTVRGAYAVPLSPAPVTIVLK